MDVRLPDGTVIQGVPDGITKAELVGKLKSNGMAVPAEWLGEATQPQAMDRQRLLSSAPMRLAKGMKDPIDGSAQLLQRILPEGVVNAVNKAADSIGGEGTFLGDVLGIKGATPQQLTQDIRDSEQEYQAARRATAPVTLSSLVTGQKDPGFDAMRLVGNIASPVNAAVGRVLPASVMPKVGDTAVKLALKGGAVGGAGALTQPVMGENYTADKVLQVGTGVVGGAVLTPVITKASESVARFIQDRLRNGLVNKTPEGIELEIKASLARDDIDIGQIPQGVLAKLKDEATQALKSGRQVDAATMLRKMDFERVGVKPTLGQVTRDPSQYTKELNLRGIQGAGEPIQNRLAEQQGVIASRLRQGSTAQTPFDAGQSLIGQLKSKDAQLKQGVREAYGAFKSATGKDLDVPTGGLANDYANTLSDFADNIPGAVRSRFESLGLMDGTQRKVLTIDDAESLIKTINKNYDPKNLPQARALDELRRSVENAIASVGDDAGSEAAILAGGARKAAAERFGKIGSTPAFKAALNGAEPDDFVRKYVINGKVRELNALADLVGPDGQKTMQQQLLSYLEKKAMGTNAAGDGASSQASFNRELEAIGRNKLTALLGQSKTDELYTLGRVMAYIQQRPAGSAVNESNTGAAIANMLGKVGGTIRGAPYINDFIVKPVQGFRDRSAAEAAIAAKLPVKASELDPNTVNALTRLLGPASVSSGAALGYSVR